MTARQLRRLIERFLLPRHPDLAVMGRYPLLGAVDDGVLRGFFPDPSRGADGFRLWAYVWPLYVERDDIVFALSRELGDLRSADAADEDSLWALAGDLTVREGRAYVDALATPAAIAANADELAGPSTDSRVLSEIRLSSQLWIGDVAAAQEEMGRLRRKLEGSDSRHDRARLAGLTELESALADGGSAAARAVLSKRAGRTAEALRVPLPEASDAET